MKRLLLAIFIGTGLVSTSVYADVSKGQKLYSKKLKKACSMTGAKMAAKHTQDEWEEINKSGRLEAEIKNICPGLKGVKGKYLPHLYDFFYEYGSDSGNVPSC